MNILKSRAIFPKRSALVVIVIVILSLLLVLFYQGVLRKIGQWIVVDEKPRSAEAVVVLCSGIEYYPRLMEAAELYNKGVINKIIINGNRKTDEIRALEARGYQPCCPWYEDSLRVLDVFSVPRDSVIPIAVEDAYDTVSEAKGVGEVVLSKGLKRIIITTSKYHTRRAQYIWKKLFRDRLTIFMVAAKQDPYEPDTWWKDGRQIRWLMAEYGAWIYLAWKNVIE